MISKLIGSCSGHDDPDLWFPQRPRGGCALKKKQEYADKVRLAKLICSTCPIKRDCLDEGMKRENLTNGIWGGNLPSERLALSGFNSTHFAPKSLENKAFMLGIRLVSFEVERDE